MYKKALFAAATIVIAGYQAISVSHAAEVVGSATQVEGKSEVEREGQLQTLATHDKIYEGDKIVTGDSGKVGLVLRDNTVFTIGPRSKASIDDFIFSPKKRQFGLTASVLKGTFRYVSGTVGKVKPKSVGIKLPFGTIGIRGTAFRGKVLDGRVYVKDSIGRPVVGSTGLPVISEFADQYQGGESLFVLDVDPDGKVGAIVIRMENGQERVLDEANEAVKVNNNKLGKNFILKRGSDVERRALGVLSAILPDGPEKFLLYFQTGKAELLPESQELLAQVLQRVQERGSQDIAIVGHTDRLGSEVTNERLSLARAKAIADFLAKGKIKRDFMHLASHGELEPIVETADNVAEPKNRRVEVTIR